MTRDRRAWLLVHAGTRLVGLELARVLEVLAPGAVHPVPTAEPAVRGVTPVRDRIVPVVHLGALLEGTRCPDVRPDTMVVVELQGRRLGLEVEGAEEVLLDGGLPVPPGTTLPWAAAVARYHGRLVPLLDLDAIGVRMMETASA